MGNIGLIDSKKKEPVNLLKAYAIDTDCFGCNDIGIIHPEGDEENGYLAYNSRRIIKIESFYCVITANNCKIISVGNKKFFESVNLTIDFTNQYFFSEEPRKYPVY